MCEAYTAVTCMRRRRRDVRRMTSTVFAEIKMDAARVIMCLAIFKLICNRSLNNEVILSAIVILIFPPPLIVT